MLGYIAYADTPFFHDLIDKSDYKIISIFEVFAINRNEDDFLENLNIIADIIQELEEEKEKEEEENKDPNMKALNDLKKEHLVPFEVDRLKEMLKGGNRILLSAINAFKKIGDLNDFVHTLKLFLKNAK